MWSGTRKHEVLAQSCMRAFSARDRRVARRELDCSCGVCQTVPRCDRCGTIANSLARDGRGRTRPLYPRALWNPDLFAIGSGCGSAFDIDGSVYWRTGGISGWRLGADGDGGDRFVHVAALVISADHGAGVDAAECFPVGLSISDVSVAGTSGLDRSGSSAVHDRRIAAHFRFCAAGAGGGAAPAKAVLDSCSTELETRALRAVLDFDSGLHFERGQPGNSWAGRGRAHALVGKPVEGVGRVGLG